MEKSRRGFLKTAGICALGLGVKPAIDVLWGDKLEAAQHSTNPEALTGSRWAMVVDMKRCWEKGKEGCKDCILACHKVHNVPDIPDRDDEVKWIWTVKQEEAFPGQQHQFLEVKEKPFIVLCNHCENPACVRVCPTKATFKRKQDGIVMMDMHRCIGCRYCMAACPFGARSFNFRDPRPYIAEVNQTYPTRERGVVEKCSFCEERLAVGQLPACVEACKVGALVFGNLNDPNSDVRKILQKHYTIRRKPELGTEPNVYYII